MIKKLYFFVVEKWKIAIAQINKVCCNNYEWNDKYCCILLLKIGLF